MTKQFQQLTGFVRLRPHLAPKIWGGSLLGKLKGAPEGQEPLGESLEISRLKGASSLFEGGILEELYGPEELPYLVKLIDTSDNLSVQVHPNDEYAQKVENSSGKTECWVILEAQKGAGLYLGLRPGVDRAQLEKSLTQKEDLSQLLQFHEVSPGDFFYVPAGTIHAIGKGILLAEIQQSSGITYRVWDWNRVDDQGRPRELHIQKALDVIEFSSTFNDSSTFKIQKNLLSGKSTNLIEHRDFKVELLNFSKGKAEKYLEKNKRVVSMLNIGDPVEVIKDGQELRLEHFESCFSAPQNDLKFEIKTQGEAHVLLIY